MLLSHLSNKTKFTTLFAKSKSLTLYDFCIGNIKWLMFKRGWSHLLPILRTYEHLVCCFLFFLLLMKSRVSTYETFPLHLDNLVSCCYVLSWCKVQWSNLARKPTLNSNEYPLLIQCMYCYFYTAKLAIQPSLTIIYLSKTYFWSYFETDEKHFLIA